VKQFLLKRIVSSAITILVFTTMLFFLANIMIPGDITNNFMPGLGAQRAVLQEAYGLNQPLWAQYLTFMQAFMAKS
jgi:peptide/nickel transport system permease protein